MAYIKVHQRVSQVTNGRTFNPYETDTNLDLEVETSKLGRTYRIFSEDNLIAEVGFGDIIVKGNRLLPLKHNAGWIISEEPKILLQSGYDGTYSINGKKVCSIHYGDALINWLIGIFKERKLRPYDPFTEIRFDEQSLDPLIALCLIFSDIKFRSSGD